jgi:predicted lipid-binding transport protein (Tim44 family)
VLIARLWSLLGTRRDDVPERPNPFTQAPPVPVAAATTALSRFTSAPPPHSLAGGLLQIQSLDPTFDKKQFIKTAREIFINLVEAYAADDRVRLATLGAPDLLTQFEKAANMRREAGQSASASVVSITESEITAAQVTDTQASITIQFISRQENILRDARGTIVAGKQGVNEEVTDHWVFGRDMSVQDSKWLIMETRV